MALLHMLAEYDEPPFLDSLQTEDQTAAMSKGAAARLCQHAGARPCPPASMQDLGFRARGGTTAFPPSFLKGLGYRIQACDTSASAAASAAAPGGLASQAAAAII
jgi:hypothetical protein